MRKAVAATVVHLQQLGSGGVFQRLRHGQFVHAGGGGQRGGAQVALARQAGGFEHASHHRPQRPGAGHHDVLHPRRQGARAALAHVAQRLQQEQRVAGRALQKLGRQPGQRLGRQAAVGPGRGGGPQQGQRVGLAQRRHAHGHRLAVVQPAAAALQCGRRQLAGAVRQQPG